MPPGRSLALLDNTANISYVAGKMLRRAGVRADLIEQAGTPFNQRPVWEDVDLVEPTRNGDPPKSSRYWETRERETGWTRPDWVVRPKVGARALALSPSLVARALRYLPPYLAPAVAPMIARDLATIAAARERDAILAVGPGGPQAFLSGRPYALVVTGWDVRELPFRTASRNPVLRARAWLQRAALASSSGILVQPASDLPHLRKLGLADKAIPYDIPVDADAYEQIPSARPEEVFGADVAARVSGATVVFAPARIHFGIKRNDALIAALPLIPREVRVHLVMLAWGPDVDRARRSAERLGVRDRVSFVPFVMSKVRLVKALRLADIVADQFLYTAYGSITREALACGKAVMSSYDAREPQPHPPDDPAPISPARTPEEIATACLDLLDPSRRESLGREGVEWTRRRNEASIAVIRNVLSV